ncbi:glutathione S-transferase [Beijerinckia indica]|uniref:Glutathione S-transferase domain n=1 Tax=Beijerinckia indica subsp. indica (strain ATCC 9039 / DSM 1715 / NCIMB 8712) TaxID=395963 RepID=B2IE95_BEII9|nr:glutathione S-transferase [Beijerinckia indica]ACB94115.1 Glutathione S-transferase domain [Beijerinckia indica subsp. indica ATCC 9039]
MPESPNLTLYGLRLSGHSHRAELMLSLLNLSYHFHAVDLAAGEQHTDEFHRLNVFETVPVLQDGDVTIADSVAILVYLALRYDPSRMWLPSEPSAAAQVQRWLSVAQGPVFNGPCTARLIKIFGLPGDYEHAAAESKRLLERLDETLTQSPFLTGTTITLADVAIYSYIAKAPEGEVSLEPYQNVCAWLNRVEALPFFLPMPAAN